MDKKPDLLAERLRKGEHQAAVELVDIYYGQLFLYFRRLGHDRQASEDLTQETFMRAWRCIYQLREKNALKSWIYHIAGNASRLYWRRNKGEKTSGLDISANPPADLHNSGQFEEEDVEKLRKAIADLPVKLRQTVTLHYLQDLTIAEAAEAAQIKQGTFKSRLNRALGKLKKKMD